MERKTKCSEFAHVTPPFHNLSCNKKLCYNNARYVAVCNILGTFRFDYEDEIEYECDSIHYSYSNLKVPALVSAT